MRPETLEILIRLKRSRAGPRIGTAHLAALLSDAEALGREGFLAAAERALSGPEPTPARPSPETPAGAAPALEREFADAEARTGLPRAAFLALAIEQIAAEHPEAPQPSAPRRLSKRRFLAHFEATLGAAALTVALRALAKRRAAQR